MFNAHIHIWTSILHMSVLIWNQIAPQAWLFLQLIMKEFKWEVQMWKSPLWTLKIRSNKISTGIFENQHAFQISVSTVTSVMNAIENKAKPGDKMSHFVKEERKIKGKLKKQVYRHIWQNLCMLLIHIFMKESIIDTFISPYSFKL